MRVPRRGLDFKTTPAPWLITYADLMSLLLTFFVLLAALSTVNEQKLGQAVSSIKNALGAGPIDLPLFATVAPPAPERLQQAARELRRRLQVLGKEEDLKVNFERGGLKIVVPEQISFDTARAQLKPESKIILTTVAETLAAVMPGSFIEVRGHTDSRPLINTLRFRDNYDLSYARADAVARHLSATGRIPLETFEVIACGPGQPIATNSTSEGQQANRRVEIFIRGKDSSTMLPVESAPSS